MNRKELRQKLAVRLPSEETTETWYSSLCELVQKNNALRIFPTVSFTIFTKKYKRLLLTII